MVFYFSGTGNSQYLAERIAAATGDEARSISAAIKDGEYSYACPRAGLVLPVYCFGPPEIALRFIARLQLSSPYVYCALTCAGSTANAAELLRRKLMERGITLNAAFSVAMVNNYIPMFPMPDAQSAAARLAAAEPAIEQICRLVCANAEGDMDGLKGPAPRLTTGLLYPLYGLARSTKPFRVTESCTGCGLCWGVCPDEVIKLTADRPRWARDKCNMCLACLHRCPAAAIQYGRGSRKKRRYVNPNVEFKL